MLCTKSSNDHKHPNHQLGPLTTKNPSTHHTHHTHHQPTIPMAGVWVLWGYESLYPYPYPRETHSKTHDNPYSVQCGVPMCMGIHGYYHTLIHKGTVFTGTGTGMGKNTRGLPMSHPTSHTPVKEKTPAHITQNQVPHASAQPVPSTGCGRGT
jgi:hypothetical protein